MEQLLQAHQKPELATSQTIYHYPPDAGNNEHYPRPDDAVAFKAWFEQQGYIVIRRAVPQALCSAGVQAFRREVLPDRLGFFERHASGKYERHVLTESGFMKYPIMNLQDLPENKYAGFRRSGLDLLTQAGIQRAIGVLFGEPGRVVHTMYFDGNQTTWAHRDGHYIDSQQSGKMIGVWVAAEDIHPAAGRFFIVPRSHRMPVPGEEGDPNSTAYKARMADFVCNGPLHCVAPVLQCGDVLLWSALTIHGSLPTTDMAFSRRSFTAHYVPRSHQFQWNVRAQASRRQMFVNGLQVVQHRDDDTLFKRLRNAIRSDMPRVYGWAQALKNRRAPT
jgi:phytanoyl-CoA hydroxylase